MSEAKTNGLCSASKPNLDSLHLDIVAPRSIGADGTSSEELDENLCILDSPHLPDEFNNVNVMSTLAGAQILHNQVAQPGVFVKTDSGKWSIVTVRVGFDITRKGERSLVIDGFKFTKSRDGMGGRVFWRCSRRECKATAVTVADRVEHTRAVHSHQPPVAAEFFADSMARCEQEVKFTSPSFISDRSAACCAAPRLRRRRRTSANCPPKARQSEPPTTVVGVHPAPGELQIVVEQNSCHVTGGHHQLFTPADADQRFEQVSPGLYTPAVSAVELANVNGVTAHTLSTLLSHMVDVGEEISPGNQTSPGSNRHAHLSILPSSPSPYRVAGTEYNNTPDCGISGLDQLAAIASSISASDGTNPPSKSTVVPVYSFSCSSTPQTITPSFSYLLKTENSSETSIAHDELACHVSADCHNDHSQQLVAGDGNSIPVPGRSSALIQALVEAASDTTAAASVAIPSTVLDSNVGFIGRNSQGHLVVLTTNQLAGIIRTQRQSGIAADSSTQQSQPQSIVAQQLSPVSPSSGISIPLVTVVNPGMLADPLAMKFLPSESTHVAPPPWHSIGVQRPANVSIVDVDKIHAPYSMNDISTLSGATSIAEHPSSVVHHQCNHTHLVEVRELPSTELQSNSISLSSSFYHNSSSLQPVLIDADYQSQAQVRLVHSSLQPIPTAVVANVKEASSATTYRPVLVKSLPPTHRPASQYDQEAALVATTSASCTGALVHWKKGRMRESVDDIDIDPEDSLSRETREGDSAGKRQPTGAVVLQVQNSADLLTNDEESVVCGGKRRLHGSHSHNAPTAKSTCYYGVCGQQSPLPTDCASGYQFIGNDLLRWTDTTMMHPIFQGQPSSSCFSDHMTATHIAPIPAPGHNCESHASQTGVTDCLSLCNRVQDVLLVKVLNTLQQLTARLDADADPLEVTQNCHAIKACLDTITAIKRSRRSGDHDSPGSSVDGSELKACEPQRQQQQPAMKLSGAPLTTNVADNSCQPQSQLPAEDYNFSRKSHHLSLPV